MIKSDEWPVNIIAACLASLFACVCGPSFVVSVTGLDDDPKFFVYTPAIDCSIDWEKLLFVVLPLNIKTQGEEGKNSYGTPSSAPINANIKKKMILVTLFTIVAWLISMLLIYLIFLS